MRARPTSLRLARVWRERLHALRPGLHDDPLVLALAPKLSNARLVRYAIGAGITEVWRAPDVSAAHQAWLYGKRESAALPLDWSVPLSLDGLAGWLPDVRRKAMIRERLGDESIILRALVAIGIRRIAAKR